MDVAAATQPADVTERTTVVVLGRTEGAGWYDPDSAAFTDHSDPVAGHPLENVGDDLESSAVADWG